MPTRVIVYDGADGARTEGKAGKRARLRHKTVTIATYNVRDGRGKGEDGEEYLGVVSAARSMGMVGVDVAVLQETKITDPEFVTRSFEGYSILAAAADSDRRGGVALLVRENNAFTIENERARGPNVISFELLSGEERWYVVGCYLPPSDKGGEAHRRLEHVLGLQPEGTRLLLLGDLNADLDFPRNRQEEVLAADLEERGLRCVTNHFVTRRRRRCRGNWTWRRRNSNGKGERAWYRSKPD